MEKQRLLVFSLFRGNAKLADLTPERQDALQTGLFYMRPCESKLDLYRYLQANQVPNSDLVEVTNILYPILVQAYAKGRLSHPEGHRTFEALNVLLVENDVPPIDFGQAAFSFPEAARLIREQELPLEVSY